MIVQKYRYLLLVLPFFLYSCNMCSRSIHEDVSVEEQSVDVNNDDTLEFYNSTLSSAGFPIMPDTIPSKIFERICYTVSYNIVTRQPNWVMWQLSSDHVMKRKDDVWNEYHEDVEIEENNKSTLADYASSRYDRGHMCPGGDCNWNDEGREETFLLSNMCPQNPNLNRGDWKEIEIACRKWAQTYGCVYIVCGPIFFKSQEHERIGPNKIPVPEAFFKVVFRPDSIDPKGIGFICRNTDGNRKKDFYVNSIKQVERVTGYKFYPKLDEAIKEKVFDMSDIDNW